MRRALSALGVLVLAAGCSAAGLPRSDAARSSEAERLLVRADRLAAERRGPAARDLYEHVLRRHQGEPERAAALYGLGRVQADPAGGIRDYRAAHATFSRLLADYPESRWATDARIWRATLGELLAREEESVRLKARIERLKRIDLDLERRR